jgi:putative peptidoglycan lipid II flippase
LVWAVGEPAISLIRFGNLDVAGVELAARVLDAYAIGLVGYAGFHLLTRASYAAGDTRTPTLVNAAITAGGSALMVGLFVLASGDDRVAVLGLAHSVAMLAAAAALWVLVRRRVGEGASVGGPLARAVGCGLAAAALGRLVGDALPAGTRLDAAVTLVCAGGVTIVVYLAGQWCLRAPELRGLRPERVPVP